MAGQDFTVSIVGTVTGFDVAPINNLNNALKQIPGATNPAVSSGQQLSNTFNQTGASATNLNNPLNTVKASATATGQSFTTTGTNARGLQSTLTPLGAGFGQVGTSATGTKGNLDQLVASLQTTGQHSRTTEQSSISLGEKIALMGGFVTTTAGHIFGLIEGFTGLEAAQLAADRAQQKVNTSALTAEKAQDNYNKVVAKFGPDSKQAQEALANLENKQNANRLAVEKNELSQKRLTEAYVSFGMEVINTVGELATLGGTISILATKLGLKTAVTTADTDANIANYLSAKGMEVGLTEEEIAAQNAALGIGEADTATAGLGLRMAAIIAPLAAAAVAFLLIETNTFGMGDAFRSVLPMIGQGIDAIVNGFFAARNAFVQFANGLESFKAQVNNIFVDIQRTIETAFNTIIVAGRSMINTLSQVFTDIVNFFINNVANPIIRAWNEMIKAIGSAVASAVGPITGAWNFVVKGIVDTVVSAVSKINDFLGFIHVPKIDMTPLTDLQANLNTTGLKSTEVQKKFDEAFKPSPLIKNVTAQVIDLGTGLIGLTGQYANVQQAGHTYDSELVALNSSVGAQIAATISYYSKQENLGKVITSNVIPAFKSAFGAAQQWTGGLMAAILPTQKNTEETNKFDAALGKATKGTKDYAAALTETVNKTMLETVATAKQVIGHQFVTKAIADTAKAVTDAAAKQQTLTTELTNGTAQLNRYNAAILEGNNKFLTFIKNTEDGIVTQNQYNALLEKSGAGFVALALGLDDTAKNMELVTKAFKGDTEAMTELQSSVKGVFDSFTKLGDEVGNKLADALEKGHKSFKKTLKEMEKETGIKFDPDGVFNLSVDASIREAEKTAKTGIGLIVDDIVGGWSSGIKDANLPNEIDALMAKISGQIKGSSPEVRQAFQTVMDDLKNIASQDIPTPASLTKLKKDLDAIDPSGNLAAQAIARLQPAISGVGGAAGTAAAPVDQFTASVQQAGTLASVWQTTIQNITIAFNTGFTRAVSDAVGQLIILDQEAAKAFLPFIPALVAIAAAFNEAFVRGVGDAIGQLSLLQNAAGTVFITIVAGLEQVVNGFNIAFTQAAQAAAAALNALTVNVNGNVAAWVKAFTSATTALVTDFNSATKAVGTVMNGLSTNINGNTANWIKAFNAAATALTNDFNTGTRNAGTAMNSLATNVNTNSNNMISSLNRVASAMNGIGNAANSAKGQVQALINSINSIPSSKTVTINIIEHRTVVTRTVPAGIATSSSLAASATTPSAGFATETKTTVLAPGIATAAGSKRIVVELREPTIIKVDSRELIKLINKKLLELDIGALL